MNSDLQIYRSYMSLIAYSNDLVRKYPKSEKFALVQEIKQSLYRGLRYLMYAIKALPYRDRVVHQWYVEEFIKPHIVPKFIHTSYACLNGKGTHKAADMMQEFMNKKYRKNFNY